MSSMENVISFLKETKFINAVSEYHKLTGVNLVDARKAVEALQPYLDPSYQKIAEASPEPTEAILVPTSEVSPDDFKGFPEAVAQAQADIMHGDPEGTDRKAIAEPMLKQGYPILPEPTETKSEINKWIITSSTNLNKDYWDWSDSEDAALKRAKHLISIKHTRVTISRVIAEAKATTTWSIEL